MLSYSLAVDIGGTFTDLAAFDEGADRLLFGKALSTHDYLVDGIEQALAGAGTPLSEAYLFLHGSTIVINTLLERTGAKVSFTNRTFPDHGAVVQIAWPHSRFEASEMPVETAP